MTDREIFQKNLTELMRVTKVKQIDLAKYVDVSYQTVSALVTGRGYPKPETMEKICQFFGIKKRELLEYEDDTQESSLIRLYRTLSNEGKQKLIERAYELTRLYPKRRNPDVEA